jgi:hypothetical protein
MKINFFTAIHYNNNPSFSQKWLERVDDYFYLKGKKIQVVKGIHRKTEEAVIEIDFSCPWVKTILKIISWFTGVIPLAFFLAKVILRSKHHFVLIDTDKAAIKIQSVYKSHMAKAKFVSKKKAALNIQSSYRSHRAEVEFATKKTAALNFQRVYRGHLARQQIKIRKETPLIESYAKLRLNLQPIEDGYGEYLVYKNSETGKDPVSKELYDQAYEIIHRLPPENYPNGRSAYIRENLQKIDPNLSAIFVPRSLYELIFIEESIKEEMQQKSICLLQTYRGYHDVRKDGEEEFEKTSQKCWHFCKFTDSCPENHDETLLRILAFRINSIALNKLPKQPLLGAQIVECTEKELNFFIEHRQTFPKRYSNGEIRSFCGAGGGAINFGFTGSIGERTICFPMGIRDNKDAQIVRNAIALECDKKAQNSVIIYRASSNKEWKNQLAPCPTRESLSYGTSLFAGSFLDGTATVFYYAIYKKRDVFATIVPNADKNPPFYIPRSSSAIRQLFSIGEFFHPRTLLSNDAVYDDKDHFTSGIWPHKSPTPKSLYSPLDSETIIKQLKFYYSNNTFPLTPDQSKAREASNMCLVVDLMIPRSIKDPSPEELKETDPSFYKLLCDLHIL